MMHSKMSTLGKLLFAGALYIGISASAFAAYPVNINTASADQLAEALNGIGPHKAQAIVDYREAHGAFTSVDDLLKVKGIGEKMLAKNREYLLLE